MEIDSDNLSDTWEENGGDMDIDEIPEGFGSTEDMDEKGMETDITFIDDDHIIELPPISDGVEFLTIQRCKNLTDIVCTNCPTLPKTLIGFRCEDCDSIKQIPFLPGTGLKNLSCRDCKNLEKITNFPLSLALIDISECPKLFAENIPRIPVSIKTFICDPSFLLNMTLHLAEIHDILEARGSLNPQQLGKMKAFLDLTNSYKIHVIENLFKSFENKDLRFKNVGSFKNFLKLQEATRVRYEASLKIPRYQHGSPSVFEMKQLSPEEIVINPFDIEKKCISNMDLTYTEELKANRDLTMFFLPNGVKGDCLTIDDLYRTIFSQERVWMDDKNHKGLIDYNNPVFKLPNLGYIDYDTMKYIFVFGFNTIFLDKVEEIVLNSGGGISSIHGEFPVRSGYPVHRIDVTGQETVENPIQIDHHSAFPEDFLESEPLLGRGKIPGDRKENPERWMFQEK